MYAWKSYVAGLVQNVRNVSACASLYAANKNHYNSLGLTPKATQADVKSAYYELSKVYHPDKAQGLETHAEKFRDITEAYEVLGNVRLRRLYDRGMYHGSSRPVVRHEEEEDDPVTRFYRARERRHRVPTPTGKTPIYDFDEWSKEHYGATFKKDQEIKARQAFQTRLREEDVQHSFVERILLVMGVVLIFSVMFFREDYDRVGYNINNPNSSSNKVNVNDKT